MDREDDLIPAALYDLYKFEGTVCDLRYKEYIEHDYCEPMDTFETKEEAYKALGELGGMVIDELEDGMLHVSTYGIVTRYYEACVDCYPFENEVYRKELDDEDD